MWANHKTNNMNQVIFESQNGDVKATWTKKKAGASAQSKGYKFTVETLYVNMNTGQVTRGQFHTKK
jgi:hypothetical protein